jgi:iron complex transport system substrate-binding protein
VPRLTLAYAAILAVALALSAGAGAATSADSFPATVTAASGKVTTKAKPVRIVSLSPTATEMLFAIGAGEQVIAVDDQSDYPKTAPKTTLSGFTPNIEAIAAYRPDLVVASYDPKDLVASLRKLGIPVLLHDAAKTLKGAYQQIRQLGTLTGNTAGAGALVERMKKRIAQVVESAKARGTGRTYFHELSPDLYTATSSTFIGRVYELFGLKNIADAADGTGSGFPQLSAEYVVAANPALIVLADSVCCSQTAATVASRPGWGEIDAVQAGSIVRIDDSIASRWGPRVVNFVRAVASALKRLDS